MRGLGHEGKRDFQIIGGAKPVRVLVRLHRRVLFKLNAPLQLGVTSYCGAMPSCSEKTGSAPNPGSSAPAPAQKKTARCSSLPTHFIFTTPPPPPVSSTLQKGPTGAGWRHRRTPRPLLR
ncbi:hypothetical protein TPASS_1030 [Treponema pallidum subsp. pallidum SS14]|uniref:Uncharacterized protein n=1 Tax=Treponema pallidum subsp. pallidum (strain SS14) TaxID=455434 RepID=A0A0H3BKK4_TREPS|nr:hypothetical protein TPASS_1030 [Treponema pallidum subsp. pallidum SS14]